MSFDYAPMAATASRLIAEYGAPVTLYRETSQSIDPVTGVMTPGTTSELASNGITTAITKEDRDSFGDVQSNDRILVLDDSEAPQEGDRVSVNSEQWSIARIREVNPAGTPLIYRVLIRK